MRCLKNLFTFLSLKYYTYMKPEYHIEYKEKDGNWENFNGIGYSNYVLAKKFFDYCIKKYPKYGFSLIKTEVKKTTIKTSLY